MNSKKHNTTTTLNYSRVIFLLGIIMIVGAIIPDLIAGNVVLTMVLVLAGLIFVALGFVIALSQTARLNKKLVVNDDTIHDPASHVGAVEILLYLFFLK